jgi:putative PIN family toxin of toxin-antitoxin system
MLKVVFDTNIYISAILTDGNCRKLLDFARRGKFDLLISESIVEEIERVIRVKLVLSEFETEIIIVGIKNITTFVSPDFTLSVLNDKPDNRLLECALAGKADYIISGDKEHLLPLSKFRGIKILSPADFLKVVIGG